MIGFGNSKRHKSRFEFKNAKAVYVAPRDSRKVGHEKERARGGCAVQKDFLVGFVGHSLSL